MSVEKYESMQPQANKMINEDGSITLMDGTPVDVNAAVENYKSYSPQANKYVMPDGSIKTLAEVLPGGEPLQDNIFFSNGSDLTSNSQNEAFVLAKLKTTTVVNPVVGDFTQETDNARFIYNGAEPKKFHITVSGLLESSTVGVADALGVKLTQNNTADFTGSIKTYPLGFFGQEVGFLTVGYGIIDPGESIELLVRSNNNATDISVPSFIIELSEF